MADAEHDITEIRLQVDGISMVHLLGPQDSLLTAVEQQLPDVEVMARGNEITLRGLPKRVEAAKRLIEELQEMVKGGHHIGQDEVASSARMLEEDSGASPAVTIGQIILTARGKAERQNRSVSAPALRCTRRDDGARASAQAPRGWHR